MSKPKLVWKKKPDPEDYEAARNFLSLLASGAKCAKLIRVLEKADSIERAAKDLLRASQLPLLSREDPHVDDDLQKIHKGKPLAPVLLVRGDLHGSPLIVADGYHRICAICFYDENAPIACRMVSG